MDLLAELEAWFRNMAEWRLLNHAATVDFAHRAKVDIDTFARKFDARAKQQAQMRANVESMRASGERVITRLNREAKNESELD